MKKPGFTKIQYCCEQAIQDQLDWAWVDTACINKESSAELSEAINSMFSWYAQAAICYAYLSDIAGQRDITPSRWFTRGWTLQELIAPKTVIFYNQTREKLGIKDHLCETLSAITGIDATILKKEQPLIDFSIAQRMSWASKRTITRKEDIAYCLLGIFDANMPLLYGEGEKAFTRLQKVIMSQSEDHSLFAWKAAPPTDFQRLVSNSDQSVFDTQSRGLLASSPAEFAHGQDLTPLYIVDLASPYSMTNRGLKIKLPQLLSNTSSGIITTILACEDRNHPQYLVAIDLLLVGQERDKFCRVNASRLSYVATLDTTRAPISTIYIKKERARAQESWATIETLVEYRLGFDSPSHLHSVYPPALWSADRRRFHGFSDLMDVTAGMGFVQQAGPPIVIILGVENAALWCNILAVGYGESVEDVMSRSRSKFFDKFEKEPFKVTIRTQWTLGSKSFVVDIAPCEKTKKVSVEEHG